MNNNRNIVLFDVIIKNEFKYHYLFIGYNYKKIFIILNYFIF